MTIDTRDHDTRGAGPLRSLSFDALQVELRSEPDLTVHHPAVAALAEVLGRLSDYRWDNPAVSAALADAADAGDWSQHALLVARLIADPELGRR